MTTIRKSLTITASQEQWIKIQIQQGGFANESEYMRHLIRLDEEKNRDFIITKTAIQEGLESGISERVRSIDEIMTSALDRKSSRDK